MKVLIIDNEANIREVFSKMIATYIPYVTESHQAKGVKSGISDVEIHDVNPLEIPKTELELRLEKKYMPSVERILKAVNEVMEVS